MKLKKNEIPPGAWDSQSSQSLHILSQLGQLELIPVGCTNDIFLCLLWHVYNWEADSKVIKVIIFINLTTYIYFCGIYLY